MSVKKLGCVFKIICTFIVMGILFITLAIYNVSSLISGAIETMATPILKAPVSLDDVSISPLSGSIALKNLQIGNPDGFKSAYAFKMKNISVSIDLASLNTNTVHIYNININKPNINYEGDFTNSNITQIQKNIKEFLNLNMPNKNNNTKQTSPKQIDSIDKHKKIDQHKEGKAIVIDKLVIANATASVQFGTLKQQITLPTLTLNDIGKKHKTSIAEVINYILIEFNKNTLPAMQNSSQNIISAGKQIQKETEKSLKLIKGLKGLFGK